MKNVIKRITKLVLVMSMVFTMINVGFVNVNAANSKPVDGTTTNQPFSSGTGGSTNFRIPALVTLSDGRLVAACDARWNHSADGYGLDTIVSYSTDNGANWNYTFANYLGDNGNVYNSDSTAFIDPALVVTEDNTIYMLVDLYPHGTYIGNVKAGTGFDSNGHLLLSNSNGSSYDYYVGDFMNGKTNVYQSNGQIVSGYTVDEYYNITGNGVDTNLFFSDSPYQVLSTSYLYLTKSIDGGETWSAPIMLNSQVKNSNDKFYGVGPGRGLVTSTGRIIFPCYTYTTQDGNTSVIYSDDNGQTWNRSADMTSQSSEAALVEADGNIYMFTRHGGYYVSTDNGNTWSTQKSVGISYTTTCQLSAMTYSKKIDGKTAILLSAPTNNRNNGKIFVGLVQDDGSINWKYTYSVNNSTYQYSCLTELQDGSIGLLYENGSASIYYTNLDISEIASGAVIGNATTITDNETGVSVTAEDLTSIEVVKNSNSTPYNGYTKSITYSITLNGGQYKGSADIKVPYDKTVFDGCNEFIGNVGNDTFSVTFDGNYLVGNVPHFSDVTISGRNATNLKEVSLYVGETVTYTDKTGNYENSYTGEGLNENIATVKVKGNDDQKESVEHTKASVTCNDLIASNSNNWSKAENYYYTPDGTNFYPVYAKRSTNYFFGTKYTYTWGYSKTNSSSDVTQIGNTQSTRDSSDAPNITVYTQSKIPAVSATTDVTITGKSVGNTSVTVGNTLYVIEVKELPPYVSMDNTPFIANTGVGDGKKITKLTTSVGLSFDIDLNVTGNNVVWSIADSNIATIDQNGNVTGVSAGETTVTATIDGISYIIPVVIRDDATSNSIKVYDFYLSEVTDTTVYMSISTSTNLIEVQEGEAIYISFNSNADTAVDFFGKPHTGYALTFMNSTNSSGDYMALNSSDPKETDFYKKDGGAGKNQRNTFGDPAVANMVQAALDKKCDGGMGWTRPSSNTNGVTSDLTFRSEKLPTVSKTVATVNNNPYSDGMIAHQGDKVIFNITVTQYEAQDDITYSNVSLIDNLNGAIFTGSNSNTKTITDLSNKAVSNDTTHTYQVEYIITDGDLDKTIVNTVDLTYTYQSAYSSGSFGGTANADAKFTAASFTPKDIVIDFGSPVKMDYSGQNAHGRYDLMSGTAEYGTISIENNVVTYTPNKVLLMADTVTLTNEAGGTYTLNVYPATSVYYEESFASYSDNWSSSEGIPSNQELSFVGNDDLYGFDSSYNTIGNSSNSLRFTREKLATAVINFNGTGLDIYNLTTSTSGSVGIYLYNSSNQLKKSAFVNTSNTWIKNDKNYYNTPIYSLKDLVLDNYTVKIIAYGDNQVSLDGFRVYNTQGNLYTDKYLQSKEANPNLAEFRDIAIAGITNIDLSEIRDWYKAGNDIINQVYDKTNNTSGALILDYEYSSSVTGTQVDVDMINNGPKNEIYLKPNEAIALNISASDYGKVAVGMRNLNGDQVSCTINGQNKNLNSKIDMYYDVTETVKSQNGNLVIVNTGSGILALTKLRITEISNSSSQETNYITNNSDTIAFALRCMAGYEEHANATINVNLKDYAGNVIATTTLTDNGLVGETATFDARTVLESVKNALPEGYAVADESQVTSQEVTYGESKDVDVLVGKTATLTVKYKKLFSRNYETVTITKVQTSDDKSYTFTRSDINKALPNNYVVNLLIWKKVNYGSTGTVNITII